MLTQHNPDKEGKDGFGFWLVFDRSVVPPPAIMHSHLRDQARVSKSGIKHIQSEIIKK